MLIYMKHKTEKNARIKFEQFTIHEEYLIHLFSIFNYLCTEEASVKISLKSKFEIKMYLQCILQLED